MSIASQKRNGVLRQSILEGLEGRRLLTAAYTLTNLTPATGNNTLHSGTAYGISNNGKIAMSYDGDAAYWANGSVHDLGITGYATDINDSGIVVGADTSNGISKPFVWNNGTETILTLNGNNNGIASAVNASGAVVGTFNLPNNNSAGFVAQLGKPAINIGTPTGWTNVTATGINDIGQIVGNADGTVNGHTVTRAFFLGNNTFHFLVLPANEQSFVAHGLTNAGNTAIDGESGLLDPNDSQTQVFHVYTVGSNGYGTPSDKGTLGNDYDIAATDMNASGTIVATIDGGAFPFEAAVYDGSWKSLTYQIDPSVGWTLFLAYAVNDSGQIVGFGYDKNGNPGAYLLTPTAPASTFSISGTVYGDSNNNGVLNSGEPVASDRTVFIDANGNGKLDAGEKQTQSDTNGKYTFSGLTPGTYKISRVFPAGYHLSSGGTSVSVNVSTSSVTGVNIGSTQSAPPPPPPSTGSISGLVFGDSNKNGIFNTGEPIAAMRTVFLDTNGNGKLDAGEESVLSDSSGDYTFDDLTAGTYKVSRVFPSGYKLSGSTKSYITVSVGAGQNVTHVNIGSVPT